MNYQWKILELSAENDVIVHARYHLTLTDDNLSVETEGHWNFIKDSNSPLVALRDVTEEMVSSWIEKDAMKDNVNIIKSRLEQQLAQLKQNKSVDLPWKPAVYTPTI